MHHPGDEPVPGFRLQSFLGRGNFGEVWKASGPGGTHVALKFISLSGKNGLKEYRSIQRMKEIRHPNLVGIIAYWLLDRQQQLLPDALANVESTAKDAGGLLIAMQLGDKNLFDRLEECQTAGLSGVPIEELLSLFEDSAKALDFLNSPRHDLGEGPVAIQHCDVKPQNIMIVGDAAAVCDFGLSRVLEEFRATTMGGSPAYIAPECLLEQRPSRSTDQYSLAISYVELRTGKLPFGDAGSLLQIIRAHTTGKLDLNLLPSAEQAVIARALARNPDDRFPSCMEMVRRLRAAALPDSFLPGGSGVVPGSMFQVPAAPGSGAASSSSPASNAASAAVVAVGSTISSTAASAETDVEVRATLPNAPSPAEQPGRGSDWRNKKQTSSSSGVMYGAAVLGCVALAAVGGGGGVWWMMNQGTTGGSANGVSANGLGSSAVKNRTEDGAPPVRITALKPTDVLDVPPQQVVEGDSLVVRLAPASPTLDVSTWSYALAPGSAAGATVDPTSGEFRFKPVGVKPGDYEFVVEIRSGEATPIRKTILAEVAARRPKLGETTTNSLGMKLAFIEAGRFEMGSPEDESNRFENERRRTVLLTQPFYMGVHEVTQSQYLAVAKSNPSYFSASGRGRKQVAVLDVDRFPVDGVSWDDAQAFCRALSETPDEKAAGRSYRLPTEAEWEFVCRAGTDGPFHFGFSLSADHANFDARAPYGQSQASSGLGRTCPVGDYPANNWGLHDMHGNVYEWCSDWHESSPAFSKTPTVDPVGPATGSSRVLRGGAWHLAAHHCRSADRFQARPDLHDFAVGFRVVCEVSGLTDQAAPPSLPAP